MSKHLLDHFIVRYIIPIVFVAATVLVGCHSPSMVHTQIASSTVAAPPPFQPMLITNFCTQTTLDGTWRIGVSETNVAVSRFAGLPGGFPGRSKAEPSGVSSPWKADSGWFVFIENINRVWAYNGDRLLLLWTCSDAVWNKQSWISGGWASYVGGYPCAVPAEVFSRLSEPAQKGIQSHD